MDGCFSKLTDQVIRGIRGYCTLTLNTLTYLDAVHCTYSAYFISSHHLLIGHRSAHTSTYDYSEHAADSDGVALRVLCVAWNLSIILWCSAKYHMHFPSSPFLAIYDAYFFYTPRDTNQELSDWTKKSTQPAPFRSQQYGRTKLRPRGVPQISPSSKTHEPRKKVV